MKLTNDQIHKIITAVCTCITTIAAIILTSACTLSLSVQKQNNNSNQGTEQTTSVDSLSINPVLKNNYGTKHFDATNLCILLMRTCHNCLVHLALFLLLIGRLIWRYSYLGMRNYKLLILICLLPCLSLNRL